MGVALDSIQSHTSLVVYSRNVDLALVIDDLTVDVFIDNSFPTSVIEHGLVLKDIARLSKESSDGACALNEENPISAGLYNRQRRQEGSTGSVEDKVVRAGVPRRRTGWGGGRGGTARIRGRGRGGWAHVGLRSGIMLSKEACFTLGV